MLRYCLNIYSSVADEKFNMAVLFVDDDGESTSGARAIVLGAVDNIQAWCQSSFPLDRKV